MALSQDYYENLTFEFRCYIYDYFAKDNLLSNLFYDECDTPFEMYSDYVLFNEIFFKSGNWGVTTCI